MASLSWSLSSAPAKGVDVLDDSCIDAFPEESDDKELLFFKDDDAEFRCLFFMSEVQPAATVDAESYSDIKYAAFLRYSIDLPLPTKSCPFPSLVVLLMLLQILHVSTISAWKICSSNDQ